MTPNSGPDRYQPHTGSHPGMDPRPIAPPVAAIPVPTARQVLAWTSLAALASVLLQVIAG